jgi:small conductance mechanosensitive channel
MRTPHLTALTILLALVLAATAPRTAQAKRPPRKAAPDTSQKAPPDTARTAMTPLTELLRQITVASHARDSLAKLADQAAGEHSAILEEQVWQQQLVVQSAILGIAEAMDKVKARGGDVSAARATLQDALASGWPRYRRQLERREKMTEDLLNKRATATPQERLEIETQFAEESERTARMCRELIDALLAAQGAGIDVSVQREFLTEELLRLADHTQVRLIVLQRARSLAAARVHRTPDDAVAQTELEASGIAMSQTTQNLETEIALLQRLGQDVTDLKVALIVARGTLTSAIFEPGVLQGLIRYWRLQFLEMLAARGPRWLFEGLMIVLILAGFGLLSRLTKHVVRRAVKSASLSQLMKDTVVGWSGWLVFAIGLVVLLRQFGVQLGPMLAGLGIAGFVLGFALQDTLSNFAAGGMILAYHPFDVGDLVEAGGAMGVVKHMSLVSTTILTADNQTLIVPNKKMWGDVIRNITSQDQRRVDLAFSIGHGNDVDAVDRLLQEIVAADARVLKQPAPVIKLDQLAEGSIKFIVRVWTSQADYWDVYWDITRAVKLRFDQEGIKFPQREMIVNLPGGRPGAPASKEVQ